MKLSSYVEGISVSIGFVAILSLVGVQWRNSHMEGKFVESVEKSSSIKEYNAAVQGYNEWLSEAEKNQLTIQSFIHDGDFDDARYKALIMLSKAGSLEALNIWLKENARDTNVVIDSQLVPSIMKAAESPLASSFVYIAAGDLLSDGSRVSRNESKAIGYLQKAWQLGNTISAYSLMDIYSRRGDEKNEYLWSLRAHKPLNTSKLSIDARTKIENLAENANILYLNEF